MSNLARIETLNPDIIDHFIETGQSAAIPKDLQLFITQLHWAASIWEDGNQRNITRAAKELKKQIKVKQNIDLSLRACKQRIFDSKNYFHIDCNVSNKYWYLDAADKFEDLAKLAVAQDKLTEAGRFEEKALEYRVKANSEMSIADFAPPIFLVSDKMTLEELDFEKKSLKGIARKDSDGYYIRLITQLPIEKDEKARLMRDAEVYEDAQIISDENGE